MPCNCGNDHRRCNHDRQRGLFHCYPKNRQSDDRLKEATRRSATQLRTEDFVAGTELGRGNCRTGWDALPQPLILNERPPSQSPPVYRRRSGF